MQLKIQRSQRQSGVVSKSVMFCVDARIHLSAEEQANVNRYRLGSQIIYSSEAAKRHAEGAGAEHFTSTASWARGLYHAAAARLALSITVDSLQRGQHIECKDLNEVLDAEDALMESCQKLKVYLQIATTFDGRETVIDFSKEEPEAVSKPVLLVAPVAPAPVVQPMPSPDADMGVTMFPDSTSADPSSPALAYHRMAPPPQTNPFQPALDWWNSLTYEQRKWITIVGGIVVLFILYKTL